VENAPMTFTSPALRGLRLSAETTEVFQGIGQRYLAMLDQEEDPDWSAEKPYGVDIETMDEAVVSELEEKGMLKFSSREQYLLTALAIRLIRNARDDF
jgi:hypothetical protein